MEDGTAACFPPVVIVGTVADRPNGAPITGARVIALAEDGGPAGVAAVSSADGGYALTVLATRTPVGAPLGRVTLVCAATGFEPIPSGLRPGVTIDLATAEARAGVELVEGVATDLRLLLASPAAGTGVLRGVLDAPAETGALVVATPAREGEAASVVADREGVWTLFNVTPGSYTVAAYGKGTGFRSTTVEVANGEDVAVELARQGTAVGSVTGRVDLVGVAGGTATAVALVPAATFSPAFWRGALVPGLGAPPPGTAPNVTGEYTIQGVPAGTYVVVAAVGLDGLVQDPVARAQGTVGPVVTVDAGLAAAAEVVKITHALEILAPGAGGPEELQGDVRLSWRDEPAEDRYQVTVVGSDGAVVWQTSEPAHDTDDPSVKYGGPDFAVGGVYQLRVTALHGGTPIAASEDQAGIFFVP